MTTADYTALVLRERTAFDAMARRLRAWGSRSGKSEDVEALTASIDAWKALALELREMERGCE